MINIYFGLKSKKKPKSWPVISLNKVHTHMVEYQTIPTYFIRKLYKYNMLL